jgi:hypothetical protein
VIDFLTVDDPRTPCDLIFVLAGRPERKSYGLELLHQGVAPRLVLSVARYEVRQTAALPIGAQALIAIRDQTLPRERHFWVEPSSQPAKISHANLRRSGTFEELEALASFLAPQSPARIALVSTSIHLRRVRFCCARIPFFAARQVCFWPVPEQGNSFQRKGWWRHGGSWRYVISEYCKLGGYCLRYRQKYSPRINTNDTNKAF